MGAASPPGAEIQHHPWEDAECPVPARMLLPNPVVGSGQALKHSYFLFRPAWTQEKQEDPSLHEIPWILMQFNTALSASPKSIAGFLSNPWNEKIQRVLFFLDFGQDESTVSCQG